jgi:hypothetical protein
MPDAASASGPLPLTGTAWQEGAGALTGPDSTHGSANVGQDADCATGKQQQRKPRAAATRGSKKRGGSSSAASLEPPAQVAWWAPDEAQPPARASSRTANRGSSSVVDTPVPPADPGGGVWLCIHHPGAGQPARVFVHDTPLCEAAWRQLAATGDEPHALLTIKDRTVR